MLRDRLGKLSSSPTKFFGAFVVGEQRSDQLRWLDCLTLLTSPASFPGMKTDLAVDRGR
jgi:hypothetical protein